MPCAKFSYCDASADPDPAWWRWALALCSTSSRLVFNVITLCIQCHHAVCSMSSRWIRISTCATTHLCHVLSWTHVHKSNSRDENMEYNHYFYLLCAKTILMPSIRFTVEPLMLHGLFYQSPCYVSGHGNFSVVLLSMEGLRVLRFKLKYINLCSDNEQRSYGFGTTSGWVINDNIFIFGQTNPLKEFCVRTKDFPTYFRSS